MRKWLRRWLGIEDISDSAARTGLLVDRLDSALTSVCKTVGVSDFEIKETASAMGVATSDLRFALAELSNKVDSRHADSVAMYEVAKQNVQAIRKSLAKTSQTGHERYSDVHARFATIGADIERIKAEQSAHLSALSVILTRSNEIAAAETREQCAILIQTIALPHFRDSHRAMLATLIREPLCR